MTKSGVNTQNITIRDEQAQQALTGKTAEQIKSEILTNVWSLGLMYLEGRGIGKDIEVARIWLQRAKENGWDEAAELLKTF